MNKNREKKLLLAPIKNINRALLLSVILFLITGIVAGAALFFSSISNKVSIFILEIATYAALGLPIIIFSRLKVNGSQDVMLPKFNLKTIRNGIICAVIAYPLMLTSVFLAKTMEINSEMTSDYMASALTGFSFLENVIRIALLPAIVEELVFRSGLFGVYSKKNVFVGIFLSATIFALLHSNLYQIPYALVGGIAFAYAAYLTDNTGTAFVAHFIINFISIIISYVNRYIDKYSPEKANSITGNITGLFMAGGVLMAGYLISRVLKKQIIPKPINLKKERLDISSFITVSLAFVISILLLLTFLYEGLMNITA